MKSSHSQAFELDMQSIKRWMRNTAIIIIPSVIVVLQNYQTTGEINKSVIMASAISILTDLARRLSTNYSSINESTNP